MSYYYNTAGQRFPLPERPLEPPDCWVEEVPEDEGEESETRGTLDELEQRARPLIDFLKMLHPHHTIIVTDDGVELLESVAFVPEDWKHGRTQ